MQSTLPQSNGGVLATEREVAGRLGISVRTLQNWRYRGGGPKYVRISRRTVRYSWPEVEAWLSKRTVANTAEVTR